MSTAEEREDEMKIDPARASTLSSNLMNVISRMRSVIPQATQEGGPRLVAVSKLKPASDILCLHSLPAELAKNHPPQIHFGENYVQELLHKAEILPKSIRWHFIGGLQSNKCKTLAEQIENLWCVESVDTEKKANELEKGRKALAEKLSKTAASSKLESRSSREKLRVYVQVNTSGEESKSGCAPGEETLSLCKHILTSCTHLQLQGLMTIGAIARSKEAGEGQENEDFITLEKVRDEVSEALKADGLSNSKLELSMGMSNDYESALRCGSDEVRVGTTIFGERPPKRSEAEKS
ncbi:hypothetical protein MMC25_004420 [Agyrium rufum]|nr:hypothetical protein [Agyrium rufum]